MEIHQELTLERQAFDAHMRIDNGLDTLPIENIDINVTFADEDGQSVVATSDSSDTSASFYIRIDSIAGVTDVSGSGVLPPRESADIHWLIIPTVGAGGNSPFGKLYFVGATLNYTLGGEPESIIVSPDSITVKPLPELTLDYFLTEQVFADDPFTAEFEPSEPFTLGVRVSNNGSATARNVAIASAQPKIVENDQGLLIDFRIVASQVNNEAVAEGLTVTFGDIEPDTASVGRWQMVTTLLGEFTEFDATVAHADELGGQLTSLVASANTHLLVRDVLVDLPGRDRIRDFLALDGNTLRLYESDKVDTEVTDLSASANLASAGADGDKSTYMLTTTPIGGFVHAQLPDPHAGSRAILSVVRSDGKVLSSANAWRSKKRNESKVVEHFVNIFDVGTPGQYTVVMGPKPDRGRSPTWKDIPASIVAEGHLLSIDVHAADQDGTIPALSALDLPGGAGFVDHGDGSGTLAWTPSPGQANFDGYNLVFVASDGSNETATVGVVTVYPGNDVDVDGDGMDDAAELAYFGTLDRFGSGDFDGDGVSDFDELTNGTDPTVGLVTHAPEIESPIYASQVDSLQPVLVVENGTHDPEAYPTYEFEVYADAAFSLYVDGLAGLAEGVGTTNWTVSAPLGDNRHYYWRARTSSGNVFSEWTIGKFFVNVTNEAPGGPAISAPSDGITVTALIFDLYVTNGVDPDGDALLYRFDVYADSGLNVLVASSGNVEAGVDGRTGWRLDEPLVDGSTYYWRAAAIDEDGVETEGPIARFEVDAFGVAPSAATVDSPSAESIAAAETDLVVANAINPGGAPLSYYFELDAVATFDSPALRQSGPISEGAFDTTSWSETALSEDVRYFWRARVSDGTSESPWSYAEFLVDAVNSAPTIPKAGDLDDRAWTESRNPLLSLRPATDGEGSDIQYHFELYADEALSTLVDSAVVSTSHWQSGAALTDHTWYYWRARAEDERNELSEWAPVRRFFVQAIEGDDPPQFAWLLPDSDINDGARTITLQWRDRDPDSDAAISLYYDTDDSGANGVLIASDELETFDEEHDFYVWDVSDVPSGAYFLYAVIADDVSSQIVYSTSLITVTNVNAAPVAIADLAYTAESVAVTISVLSNDSDLDGDTLVVVSLTDPAKGRAAIELDGETVTYTPDADYYGTDTFIYTVIDGNGGSAAGAVSVTIAAVIDEDGDNDGVADSIDAFPENPSESVDTDGDGMGDSFEIRFGLDPENAADNKRDPDTDGLTNLQEFQRGLNPTLNEGAVNAIINLILQE